MIGLGGRGEIRRGLKWLHSAPLYADIQSHLSNPLTIQPVVARERKLALIFFFGSFISVKVILLTFIFITG